MKPNLYRPHCSLREIGGAGQARDRRTVADMIGEPAPTNSSTELPNHSLSLRAVESDEPSGGGDDAGLSGRFEELTNKFPFSDAMSRPAAWREFAKLGLSDQQLAIGRATVYASACERQCVRFPPTWRHGYAPANLRRPESRMPRWHRWASLAHRCS
jgi:hypothetical protein